MPGNKGKKEPVRIVIIGKTGSGKSALANVLLGRNRFKCGTLGSSVTTKTEADEGDCNGIAVKVVDTPGFFDNNVDDEVTKREIIRCIALSGKGIHVFLHCIEIGRFTEEDNETFRRAKCTFGDSVTKYMYIVFTNEDKLDKAGETGQQFINKAPQNLKKNLNEIGNKYIFINSTPDNLDLGPALNSLSTIINGVNTTRLFTLEKFKKGIDILKRLVEVGQEYEEYCTQWKGKIADITQEVSQLETDLNGMDKNVRISKVTGGLASIAGGTMMLMGVVAAAFTFGTSLALTVAGGAIGSAGVATASGAAIADTLITKKRKKQIDTLSKEKSKLADKLGNLTKSFTEALKKAFSCNEITCIIEYVLGKSVTASNNELFKQGLIKVLEHFLSVLNAVNKFPEHMDDYDTNRNILNIFVGEVREFIDPKK